MIPPPLPPPRYTSEAGSLDMVEILLEDWRVDPSAQDRQAVRQAEVHRHVLIHMLLLDRIRNPLSKPEGWDEQEKKKN